MNEAYPQNFCSPLDLFPVYARELDDFGQVYLSQNVRRVQVCKRHLLPARDHKARMRSVTAFHGARLSS